MDLVYKFLDTLNINKEDNLVVAVSFGPDSMMLLDLLKNKYKDNKIICAHVHHNHRKESDIEKERLEEYCKLNNIIFEYMKIDSYKNNIFTEEEARNKRYLFFNDVLKKYNSKYLFTAHHGDDLVETILMKINRGSSIKGYTGINKISKRDNYNIIRPLLYITKEDILNYCLDNNIPYAVDKSNLDNSYTRNRFRNNILPLLKKENNNIHLKFLSYSEELDDYYNYVDKKVRDVYKNVINNNEINTLLLKDNDDFIIKKVLEKYLINIYKDNIKDVVKTHLISLFNMVKSNKSSMMLSLPNKKTFIKSYNKIYLDKDVSYNSYCYNLNDEVILPNNYKIIKKDKLDDTTNFHAAFLKDEISFPLSVRNVKENDYIEVLNLNGKKKIKDIFVNEKIDKDKRINYPVLVDNDDNILWLPGIKKSKYDRSKKGKYDIIFKYVKEDLDETK